MQTLPSYVTHKDNNPFLREPAQKLEFPLSPEAQNIISLLEAKYDSEENCAGLAAPQLGFGYRIIVFEVEADPKLKARRLDLDQTMPKSIWINPEYEAIGDEITEDWEGCFSVAGSIRAKVKRHTKIKYSAFDVDGNKIEGEAMGFLARVIQHETDHLNGILFIDLVKPEDLVIPAPNPDYE